MEKVTAAPLLPRVAAVEALPDMQLLLTFTNGECRRFDAAPLLALPAYKRLPDVFAAVRVAFGTAVFPGDLDICPDMLYLQSKPIN